MAKKKTSKCTCSCHTAESAAPVAAMETPAPTAVKSKDKAKKGKSPAQIRHQSRFGLVSRLKKQHPDWTSEQLWSHARKEIP